MYDRCRPVAKCIIPVTDATQTLVMSVMFEGLKDFAELPFRSLKYS